MAIIVKVATGKQIPAHESPTNATVHGGDWVKVKNKQHLKRWIAQGIVYVPDWARPDVAKTLLDGKDVGVYCRRPDYDEYTLSWFGDALPIITTASPLSLAIPYKRTLIWNGKQQLEPHQMALGFDRLTRKPKGYNSWECAAMWMGNKNLIQQIGPQDVLDETIKIVGDGRVPAYNPAAVWIRNTEAMQAMIVRWQEWLAQGVPDAHAFIRAIYAEPVMLCTLPANWLGKL